MKKGGMNYLLLVSVIATNSGADQQDHEPLTLDDFEYAESDHYLNITANEVPIDETCGDLFEGDIELSEDQKDALKSRGLRSGLSTKDSKVELAKLDKWPKDSSDGLVKIPLKLPTGLTPKQRADFAKAVLEFKNKTCIRFVPWKNEKSQFILIDTNTTRCSSSLGMSKTFNNVKIGARCSWGAIIHEFKHILGFSNGEKIFEKLKNESHSQWNNPKINGLSSLDIRSIDKIYNCSGHWTEGNKLGSNKNIGSFIKKRW